MKYIFIIPVLEFSCFEISSLNLRLHVSAVEWNETAYNKLPGYLFQVAPAFSDDLFLSIMWNHFCDQEAGAAVTALKVCRAVSRYAWLWKKTGDR